MEINFDNLRIKLAQAYNNLVDYVKNGELEKPEYIYNEKGVCYASGDILLEKEVLSEKLADIKHHIGMLLACYNGQDVSDVSEAVDLIDL